MGLIDDARWSFFERKQGAIDRELARLNARRISPEEATPAWCQRVLGGAPLGRDVSAMELLRRPGLVYEDVLELIGGADPRVREEMTDQRIAAQLKLALEVQARYTGYIERAQEEIERARRNEHTQLPTDLDYAALAGLSSEVRQKLSAIRPATLGQAARVAGVTPAAVAILLVHLKKRRAVA